MLIELVVAFICYGYDGANGTEAALIDADGKEMSPLPRIFEA
jgi:hypothetical protein